MDTRAKLKPRKDFIQSTADPAVFAKKLTQVALRRAVLTRTVDQIFNPDERDEIEEEMQESDHIFQRSPDRKPTKKRLEDINLQIDEKRAVSKAQTRVSF